MFRVAVLRSARGAGWAASQAPDASDTRRLVHTAASRRRASHFAHLSGKPVLAGCFVSHTQSHTHPYIYAHARIAYTHTGSEIREKVIPGYRRALTRCQHRAHIQTHIHSNTNVTHPRDQASSSSSSFPYGKIITRILTTPHT